VANETKHPENPSSEDAENEKSSGKKSKFAFFGGHSMQFWLIVLLISTIVIHGMGLAYYKFSSASATVEYTPEISLGNYEFTADRTAGGRVTGAEFSLFITALEGLDRIARTRLDSYKFRVQESVEALLRQAHSGDFEDPTLSELKRQIREQIDQVLKNRVVKEVIIANLKLKASNDKGPASPAESASSPPWLEKSSSFISQQGGK
jgi:flagellar basal body-associated protein FliL